MMLGRGLNEAGRRFGHLVALSPDSRTKNGTLKWLCECDCGTRKAIMSTVLRSGSTISCGCQRGKNHTHGMTKTRTYTSWKSMWARCTNPKSPDFKYYGKIGITVCDRWKSFENFLADMGERPAGLTLDRERNAEGYKSGNCQWATAKQQANNRRKAVKRATVVETASGSDLLICSSVSLLVP